LESHDSPSDHLLENAMTASPDPAADGAGGPKKSITRHFPTIARVLLGLLFTITGLNGFLDFIPKPKDPMPEAAAALAGALMGTRYMLRLIAGTQLLSGVLLVTGLFVPLALALLAPVVVNIVAFHAFLAPKGLGIAVAVLVLELFLAWSYRRAFAPMLAIRVSPGGK
jgi:uncharacterized membrane protein YphA (DoxX/SURF4 family)